GCSHVVRVGHHVSSRATRGAADLPDRPQPPRVAQLVFGAGAHACPGAPLARAHLDDTLRLLAPYRPVVVRARVDRHAALPGWAEDRKSTRLNSSHVKSSYAVFCVK